MAVLHVHSRLNVLGGAPPPVVRIFSLGIHQERLYHFIIQSSIKNLEPGQDCGWV